MTPKIPFFFPSGRWTEGLGSEGKLYAARKGNIKEPLSNRLLQIYLHFTLKANYFLSNKIIMQKWNMVKGYFYNIPAYAILNFKLKMFRSHLLIITIACTG